LETQVRCQHSKQVWWADMHTFVANFLSCNTTKELLLKSVNI